MNTIALHIHRPTLTTAFLVEIRKLRASLALLLALVAPTLIAVFVFFNLLRLESAPPAARTLLASTAIWAFFMLPMSVTALTALLANTEHGPRSWDHLRALPVPRWQFYAAKAACVLVIVAAMSVALLGMVLLAMQAAAWIKPVIAPTGDLELGRCAWILLRMFLAAWLLVAVQLWIALRWQSFVPALATGIGGTFFAVVATSAKIGAVLPWQIPVNQLSGDPVIEQFALLLGFGGGCVALLAMLLDLSRREVR